MTRVIISLLTSLLFAGGEADAPTFFVFTQVVYRFPAHLSTAFSEKFSVFLSLFRIISIISETILPYDTVQKEVSEMDNKNCNNQNTNKNNQKTNQNTNKNTQNTNKTN